MSKILTVFLVLISLSNLSFALTEVVYVESPTDTDGDGKKDLIYVSISRPNTTEKLSTIFKISPYATGGDDSVAFHNTDMDYLPQDEMISNTLFSSKYKLNSRVNYISKNNLKLHQPISRLKYANISAHSLGTGRSKGCPTVGDMSETLAAKAVIDWLGGRANAYTKDGEIVKATWANGKVGMMGISYNGTLPIMVASTGVKGLKAIVPIAAISNWYNYYRANGLVVNPGGYIGEDADVLGKYIVRKNTCAKEMDFITKTMGRENGDFTKFWQDRNYLPNAKNITAATFIIHGQSDWNVKQKHAIQLWEAIGANGAPRKMFLHRGGHGSTNSHGVPGKIQDWFDHYLQDIDNGIDTSPRVEVELKNRTLITQNSWPHEDSHLKTFYFHEKNELKEEASTSHQSTIIDAGKSVTIKKMLRSPLQASSQRLLFLSETLTQPSLLTGTPKISLSLAVLNRKAANLSIAIVEYEKNGSSTIVTRGWADPQNYRDMTKGELLIPGKSYNISFNLEPKQHRFAKDSKIGVLITSTDYNYTLRPNAGTKIEFDLGQDSFIQMRLR